MTDQKRSEDFVTLGELVTTQKGFAFKSAWFSQEGRKIVKVSNFSDNSVECSSLLCIPEDLAQKYERYRLATGDILIQTVGSWPNNPASVVGKVVRAPYGAEGALLNQNAVKLTPLPGVHNTYLYYALKSSSFSNYIVGTAQGAANQASVTLESIRGYCFNLPSFPAQDRIASILCVFDDLIENNTRRIEILEEMARRLYEEWFVQFRFPGHEEKQLAFEQLNIFDIFSVKYGKGLSKKELIDGGEFPVYGAAKVIGHYHSYTYADRQIIAGCRGSVGEFRITEPKSFVTNNSFVFLPRASVDFFWGYQALKMRGLKDVIGGAAQPQITLDALQSISIPYPSNELREAYSDSVSPLFSMVWNLERKNKNLRTQRDLLLPKLISGEIDVSDIPMPA